MNKKRLFALLQSVGKLIAVRESNVKKEIDSNE